MKNRGFLKGVDQNFPLIFYFAIYTLNKTFPLFFLFFSIFTVHFKLNFSLEMERNLKGDGFGNEFENGGSKLEPESKGDLSPKVGGKVAPDFDSEFGG